MGCNFTLFYCLLDLICGECNVISLYFLCCSVNGSVCLVWCVSKRVCDLFGETNSFVNCLVKQIAEFAMF